MATARQIIKALNDTEVSGVKLIRKTIIVTDGETEYLVASLYNLTTMFEEKYKLMVWENGEQKYRNDYLTKEEVDAEHDVMASGLAQVND